MNFKSSEIYKVNGQSLKPGTFISKDGTEVEITPEIINKIYQNVKGHIPYYLSHDNPLNRIPIGYAYKVGKSDDASLFSHEGFVFDKKAQNEIAFKCSDKVSPEIDLEIDKDGKIINASLHSFAFVSNPAIDNTTVEITRESFSAPSEGDKKPMNKDDITISTDNITPTPTYVVANPVSGSQTPGQTYVMVPTGTDNALHVEQPKTIPPSPIAQERQSQISATIVDVGKYEEKIKSLEMKLEENEKFKQSVFTDKYNAIVNDLKTLGVNDVDSIVNDLPVDQKISVLSKMKEKIVKTAPLGTPSDNLSIDSSKDSNSKLESKLKELNISKDYYESIMNKKKGR